MEILVKGLTSFSFVLTCWVAHRLLQTRDSCISSDFIAYVYFPDTQRIENCRFESRLDVTHSKPQLSSWQIAQLRSLESLSPLRALFPKAVPKLTVEFVGDSSQTLAIGPGLLRLNADALTQTDRLKRALVMGILRTELPTVYDDPVQLELMGEFLTLALFEPWHGFGDIKLPTATLAYERLRPLLASGLWRIYEKLELSDKVAVLSKIRNGLTLSFSPPQAGVENLVDWVHNTLTSHAQRLGMADPNVIRRALKELEAEAPTHWELTVDVTATPAWRKIVEQLKAKSRTPQGKLQRTLVFTPEGQVALPSGLQVEWAANEIRSQKHLMIACKWPNPSEVLHIEARQFMAEQNCDESSSDAGAVH